MDARQLAAVVAWVREPGASSAPEPRLDVAVEAFLATAQRPTWWPFPPADAGLPMGAYFPTVGPPLRPHDPGIPRPAKAPGLPGVARATQGPRDARQTEVQWSDVLDNTFLGDTVRSVAARVGIGEGTLRRWRSRDPERAAELDRRMGRIPLFDLT